ncbi:hypothetical protein [Undibacterium sp.]|uniref:hypothetical protein n=1 Tax=Undibacterium sp. TaxID=1914977 RepID=UPI0037501FBB
MKKPKLTKWFDGSVKPVRDGVYERKYPGEPESVYNKFANGKWYVGGWTIEQADFKSGISEYQNDPWRGLTQNPEVKP